MMTDRLITECPAGCGTNLVETSIVMAEGSLLRCVGCGHLVSKIQEPAYRAALRKFDCERGTLPSASSQDRHDQRAARLFRRIRAMLGVRAEESIRLLDIGCSTGALIMSALRERIDAEGCEPAERAARAAQAAGLRVFPGTLESAAYPSGHFHAATLMEVIEHLPSRRRFCKTSTEFLRRTVCLSSGRVTHRAGPCRSWAAGGIIFSWSRSAGTSVFLRRVRWRDWRSGVGFVLNGLKRSVCGSPNRIKRRPWCTAV